MKTILRFPWQVPQEFTDKISDSLTVELNIHWWKNKYNLSLPPRGYIWLIHGIGEHAGRYDEFARFLTLWGFDVLAVDHLGHGLLRKQGGFAAQLHSLKVMRASLNAAVEYWNMSGPSASAGAAQKPWFVLGHSLGGLLVLSWILKAREEGFKLDFAKSAYISAPPLRLKMPVAQWKEALAQKINPLMPHLELANDIEIEGLSLEGANRAAYREDQLVHGKASPETFLSIVSEAQEILLSPADIEIPVAIAVGEEDPIVDPAAVEEYYHSLATHKSLLKFPEVRHEILNDISKREVYRSVVEWFL